MEAGIQQLLTSAQSVSALIGSRMYPVLLPDEPTLPAATYQRVSTVRDYTTTGPVSLSRIRLQIDCWANTYAEVKALHSAIVSALELFQGELPDGTYIESIQLDAASDLFESASRYYRVNSDYIVFAVE